eukprot:5503856-Amphidinium_carterae.1
MNSRHAIWPSQCHQEQALTVIDGYASLNILITATLAALVTDSFVKVLSLAIVACHPECQADPSTSDAEWRVVFH